jgi:hypothetical protein
LHGWTAEAVETPSARGWPTGCACRAVDDPARSPSTARACAAGPAAGMTGRRTCWRPWTTKTGCVLAQHGAVSGRRIEEDMGMQFDHLMHWVPDLDAATRAYQGLGFTIQPGGEHPGVGTRNAAWRIDARYVELITVHDEGSHEPASARRGPRSTPTCAPVVVGWHSRSWSPMLRRP